MASPSTSDLNNLKTFPTFLNLPNEYDINDTYFSSTRPRKHWCFLGRVVSSGVLVRLMLEVEDKKGHKILVAFHTEDRGAAFQALCTPGSTLAVLYATQHTFAFSPPGLRLEEAAHVKVFPYALEKMLGASKEVLGRHSVAKCQVCGRVDETMQRCARCKTAWYCSKACETSGWVTHKEKCPIFRDVQWFATKNWGTGVNTYTFVEQEPCRTLKFRWLQLAALLVVVYAISWNGITHHACNHIFVMLNRGITASGLCNSDLE